MNSKQYGFNLNDFNFILWDQLDIENTLLNNNCFNINKNEIKNQLKKVLDFSKNNLFSEYIGSDRQGCEIINEFEIKLPKAYPKMWSAFKTFWNSLNQSRNFPLLNHMMAEIFMGANPSFMTYSGFAFPSARLIEQFGTSAQIKLFTKKLFNLEWTSCLCITERDAGSDVHAIKTTANKQEDGTYLIKGEKIFISAGMHQLTENIIYFVLAKTIQQNGAVGLSCFIVPKIRITNDGYLEGMNNISCTYLPDKMGFNGCANPYLHFGKNGDCIGYLLGEKENIGLLQLMTLMNQARISTGIYALGLASNAYFDSLSYAKSRIQGKNFLESFNLRASRVPIIEHPDIKKMLLEMKSKIEGCRGLIARLSYYDSLAHCYSDVENMEHKEKHHYYKSLVGLLTPIVKAYVSDEAWRVCELAIQIHGGRGYTKDYLVELYARDVKILSIWEGTNYIQSQHLLRDKLALGKDFKLFNFYLNEMHSILKLGKDFNFFKKEYIAINKNLEKLSEALKLFVEWFKEKRVDKIPGYFCLFLKMMAICTLAVLHLEAAIVAYKKLQDNSLDNEFKFFYKNKINSAVYYIKTELPNVAKGYSMIQDYALDMEDAIYFNSDLEEIY